MEARRSAKSWITRRARPSVSPSAPLHDHERSHGRDHRDGGRPRRRGGADAPRHARARARRRGARRRGAGGGRAQGAAPCPLPAAGRGRGGDGQADDRAHISSVDPRHRAGPARAPADAAPLAAPRRADSLHPHRGDLRSAQIRFVGQPAHAPHHARGRLQFHVPEARARRGGDVPPDARAARARACQRDDMGRGSVGAVPSLGRSGRAAGARPGRERRAPHAAGGARAGRERLAAGGARPLEESLPGRPRRRGALRRRSPCAASTSRSASWRRPPSCASGACAGRSRSWTSRGTT